MLHAFISDGRLYIYDGTSGIREIESQFVRHKLERSERQTNYHSWKNHANDGDPYFNSSVVWGKQASAGLATGFRFKDVIVASEKSLYYTIGNGVVTGLFKYDVDDDFETRLFHKNDLTSWGIDYSNQRQEFVLAVEEADGRVNLDLLNDCGSAVSELTGGDSRDSNPSFSRCNPNQILFQAAGIARDENGYPMMYGPEGIYKHDTNSDGLIEVLTDDNCDLLLPKEDASGNLYFIRRPYRQPGQTSLGRGLINALLFPFHFISAVVGFLEAFTKLFNQQAFRPGGPELQTPRQEKYVRVFGQTIQLAKIQRKTKSGREPSLVPPTWELLRMSPDRQFEVIARNVAFYDIDQNNNIYYTNGYRVNKIMSGKSDILFKHNLIEHFKTRSR